MKYIGYALFAVLFVLSIVFYQDRMMMPDTSFLIVNILYDDALQIQVGRFVAAFTQFVPFFLSKLHAPLWLILMAYSGSFVAFYAFFYALFAEKWKENRWAWVVLLYCLLMMTHVFYWVQAELHQGMVFVLLSGILVHKAKKWNVATSLLALFSIVTACYSHPLSLFPFLFMMGYLGLNADNLAINRRHILTAVRVFIVIFLLKNYAFPVNYYDTEASEAARQNFHYSWKRLAYLQTFRRFFSVAYLADYWIFIASFLGVIGFYSYQKKWFSAAYLACFVLGYFWFITACYPKDIDQFYIEHFYLPMSLFVAFPLAFEILPAIEIRKKVILVCILSLVRLFAIYRADETYAHRVAYMNEILTKTALEPAKKLVIDAQLIDKKHFLLTWGTGYQALLQSALLSPDSCRLLLFTNEKDRYKLIKSCGNKAVMEFDTFSYQKFPTRYFRLQDTSKYIEVEKEQPWLGNLKNH